MKTHSARERLQPLAIALAAVLIAGAATAQNAAPDRDTVVRAHMRAHTHRDTATMPGGAVHALHVAGDRSNITLTPIKHVILIIGENRTFDHVYATYRPPAGQTIDNLLSKHIVNVDGTPGPRVDLARQYQATNTGPYSAAPLHTSAYKSLPSINTGGAPTQPYFPSTAVAQAIEPGLPSDAYGELVEGGTGLPNGVVDTRFPVTLPNAPVDMHASVNDHAYANSPVHRFFQMWQQLDCSMQYANTANPSGCRSDLFPWVETTVGAGANGGAQPSGFNDQSTGEGSTAMQFLNMAQGDAPYMEQLARTYTLSDNMHQSVMGGTGANHIMLGFGSLIWYADANGAMATPPANQIENPDARFGTDNWYTQDGYGGGSYVACANNAQPGVASVRKYLRSLPYTTFRNGDCQPGAYYLVNNYNPGFLGDGTPAPLGADQFTLPPTKQNNVALLLNRHQVSWKYYGEGWDGGKEDGEFGTFCNICDPFLYSTQIMTDPVQRAHNQDLNDLYADLQGGTLPAVSIVKPDAIVDGHPASSKLELFEGFVHKIVDMAKANPNVWADTAIVVTFDEGGGYWDSGYVQPVDFFGDGSRIPLLVVSRYSHGGRVVHTYYDHVSFDKFVEANWGLQQTISPYSRDNLPNPVARADNAYVPANAPAIGNLMDMFDFGATPGTKD